MAGRVTVNPAAKLRPKILPESAEVNALAAVISSTFLVWTWEAKVIDPTAVIPSDIYLLTRISYLD